MWETVVAGVVYGLVLAVVAAGILMPIWLSVVGFPTPPSVPNVTAPLLIRRAAYGALLGAFFPFVDEL